MSRTLAPLVALLVGLVLLPLGACSTPAGPAAPPGERPTKVTRAAPYRLERVDALKAARDLRPHGFERVLTCRRRQHEGCQREGTEQTRWLVGTQAHGAPLPRGNGLAEFVRTIVTAWPTAAKARAYADQLTAQLKRYRGEYDILLEKTGPDRYTPGDRGRGELHRVSFSGWRGTALRRVFHHVFYDLSPSASVPGGHLVLRRGRFVVDVEWVARTQRTDRRLSHLPRRLLRGLG
jgi:hypothetical protein